MAQPTPQEVEAQAYAFRQLVQHLQNTADDAQNIDVMSVAGMCRNCVAKWFHRGSVSYTHLTLPTICSV